MAGRVAFTGEAHGGGERRSALIASAPVSVTRVIGAHSARCTSGPGRW
jgi:hypothetical protein